MKKFIYKTKKKVFAQIIFYDLKSKYFLVIIFFIIISKNFLVFNYNFKKNCVNI